MRFDPKKYFKFTVLEDMEDLVGKTIKSFHEDGRYDYFAFLTDDNSILAFSASGSGYGGEHYAEIEIVDTDDIARTMRDGKVDSFYERNNLIDIENYSKDYQNSLKAKQKETDELQRQKEYQQYLNLKIKFENE